MADSEKAKERIFLFGPFRLSVSKRVLLEDDKVVRLGGKAIEILIALVNRAGELVSKRELVAIGWPDTTVIEANLAVQVAALRRALGETDGGSQYIANSPGRGYRFVAPIRILDEESSPPSPVSAQAHNLPAQLVRLIGRAEALQSMKRKLEEGRLLSVVGPPGIGKTTTALRLAEMMVPEFRHGVWVVDLSAITSDSLLPSALASALPVEVRSSDILSGIAAALRYKTLLLVFDNCEHLIDGAATAIGVLLRAASEIKIMTTSREPLRIEGERVYRLPSLDAPPSSVTLEKDALSYPAVQLFVERAAAIVNDFELTDANAAYAAQICRGLDGNPLAIEVAAARVDAFGVKGLASRIDDRMNLLDDVHRATPERHRTIGAALDWSYQLLNERERYVLRCLGIFAGSFTLEAAVDVIPAAEDADTASILADLVCKSLLSVDIGPDGARFRLLEITKAFTLAKLIEKSERSVLANRLAFCLTEMLRKCADGPNKVQTVRDAVQELDNVRGILSWAFAPSGQARAGVALAAAAVPVWLENSLLTECIGWTTKAIEALDEPTIESERNEMILKAALGLAAMFTEGMTRQAREALNRSIELAAHLGGRQWELRARLGLAVFLHRRGDLRGALAGTERIESLVADTEERAAMAMMKSVKSASLFFHAEYSAALKLARESHEYFRVRGAASQIGRWGLNHSIYAQCVMARTYWHQGYFDRTLRACLSAHSEAEETGNPTSICQALSWCGCSLFMLLEDLERAAEAIERFTQVAQENNIQSYLFSALAYKGRLLFLRGDIEPAERLLREALSKLGDAQYENLYIPFLGRLAELLAVDGRPEEAILASAETLERIKATEALWLLPDALKIHGDVLASLEGPDSRAAEAYLRESIEVAGRQEALGWELRSAESLANFLRQQGRNEVASAFLAGTLGKFVEGLETVPFRRCKTLLDELRIIAPSEEARHSVHAPGARF